MAGERDRGEEFPSMASLLGLFISLRTLSKALN